MTYFLHGVINISSLAMGEMGTATGFAPAYKPAPGKHKHEQELGGQNQGQPKEGEAEHHNLETGTGESEETKLRRARACSRKGQVECEHATQPTK